MGPRGRAKTSVSVGGAAAVTEGTGKPRGRGRILVLTAIIIAAVAALMWSSTRAALLIDEAKERLHAEQWGQADQILKRALEVAPENAEVHFWLARTSRKLGDVEQLKHHLDEAERLGFEPREKLKHEWWMLLASTGYLSEVENRLPRMLQVTDEGPEVCEAFVNGYCLNLRFKTALQILDAWQADHKDDYRPWMHRASVHASREDWTDAVAAYEKALKLAPEKQELRRGLATACLESGEIDRAYSLMKELVTESPEDVELLASYAELLYAKSEFIEAGQILRRVLKLTPDNFRSTLSLGKILLNQGLCEDAVNRLEPVLKKWPNDLELMYTCAQAYRQCQRIDEAEVLLKRYNELGDVLDRLEALKDDVNENPASVELRFELGRLLLKHVSRPEGVAWLRSVFFYAPDHKEARELLADYYERMGDAETAKQYRFTPSEDPTQSLKEITNHD